MCQALSNGTTAAGNNTDAIPVFMKLLSENSNKNRGKHIQVYEGISSESGTTISQYTKLLGECDTWVN